MQLVTFGIDNDKNLIIQFPVFVQPYDTANLGTIPTRKQYQFPCLDQNDIVHSYTHLQFKKPYIALYPETYISLR